MTHLHFWILFQLAVTGFAVLFALDQFSRAQYWKDEALELYDELGIVLDGARSDCLVCEFYNHPEVKPPDDAPVSFEEFQLIHQRKYGRVEDQA